MPFATIAGHQRLLALLARAIARDTLPPSLLLAGTSGIGKRRTAMAMAEALNCLAPRKTGAFETDACGECASCRRIARGVHADVVVLEPGETGTIKIEPVRDVIDRANYRPFEGRRRVVIVDEADALVDAAQNALLKTLEEPPQASVFILVSSMPDALLATVRSRCRPLRFGELAAADVAATLMRDHEYDEADARAAAAEAGGSIGRALAAGSADLTEARDAAQRLLNQAARACRIPARRLEAVRGLTGKVTGAAERDQMADLPAGDGVAAEGRRVARRAAPIRLAGKRRSSGRSSPPVGCLRQRAEHARVRRGRSRAGRTRPQRQSQGRGGLARPAALTQVRTRRSII